MLTKKAAIAVFLGCCFLLLAAPPAFAVQYVQGGDFEGGTALAEGFDSPSWIEADNQFESPICSIASCGSSGGTVGPHGGTQWVWFGGYSGPEAHTQTLTQTLTLPAVEGAAVSLSIWSGLFARPSSVLAVKFDTTVLLTVNSANQATYATSYHEVKLPIGSVPAGTHTLSLEYSSAAEAAGFTNLSLDDVGLDATPVAAVPTVNTDPVKPSPLDTKLTKVKVRKNGTARFVFAGSGGSGTYSFECKLDKGAFKPCASPKRYSGLKPGSKHTFKVRATDSAGLRDIEPAKRSFTVPDPS